jgi:uncharacterized protein YbjT (DUF2867 family)
MAQPILVAGAAGGAQGSTGRTISELLIKQGALVRALVHKSDERSDRLRDLGAEVVQGDLLDPRSIHAAMQGIKRAYFTYPVAEGLLEATAIFAAAARDAETELVVNMSQLQSTSEVPSFRNLQHRLADQVFDWARAGAVHLQAPPFFENVRALIVKSVAEQDAILLPWGDGNAAYPLVAANDVARAAAALLSGPGLRPERAYDLVGETATANEIASTLSMLLKRPIRYVEITDEQWSEALTGRINSHALDHLSHLWRFFRTEGSRSGADNFHISKAISDLIGAAPQSLEQFFRINAGVFVPRAGGVNAK